MIFTDRRSGWTGPTAVQVSAAKDRCMASGSVCLEVTSLESPSGGCRAQRVQTEEVNAVLSALDARSLTDLAWSVEDGVQRRHDHSLFQTAITS